MLRTIPWLLLYGYFYALVAAIHPKADQENFKKHGDLTTRLFSDASHFAKHDSSLFEGLSSERMYQFTIVAAAKGFELRREDVKQISKSDNGACESIEPIMPLMKDDAISQLSFACYAQVEGEKKLSREQLRWLSSDFLKAADPEFMRNIGTMICHLSAPQFETLLGSDSGKCSGLEAESLNCLDEKQARLIDASCFAEIEGTADVQLRKNVLEFYADDIFAKVPVKRLSKSIFSKMTSQQLLYIFLNLGFELSREQIGAVPFHIMEDALNGFITEPERCVKLTSTFLRHLQPKAFSALSASCVENMDHKLMLTMTPTQLSSLAFDAFSYVHPKLLARLTIDATHGKGELASPTVSELIKHLGKGERHDGRHSCEQIGVLFAIMPASQFGHFTEDCIRQVAEDQFRWIKSPGKLSNLNSSVSKILTAGQVGQVDPAAFKNATAEFMQALGSSVRNGQFEEPGCQGLTAPQLNNIKHSQAYQAISPECINEMPTRTITALTKATVHMMSDKAFSFLDIRDNPDPEMISSVFSKMTPSQVKYVGSEVKEDIDHPCLGAKIPWSKLGGDRHKEALAAITGRCFGLLGESALRQITAIDFLQMADDILKTLESPSHLASIQPSVLANARSAQLKALNSKACEGFQQAQLQAIFTVGLLDQIEPQCIAAIDIPLWQQMVRQSNGFSDHHMQYMSYSHVVDLKWLAKSPDAIKASQWHNLGSCFRPNDLNCPPNHPCGKIRFEDVRSITAFWSGMNPECLAASQFVELLGTAELDLLPDQAFANLNADQRQILYKKLGASSWRLEVSDCSHYTLAQLHSTPSNRIQTMDAFCVSKLDFNLFRDPILVQRLSPLSLSGLTAMQVSMIPPGSLGALSETAWRNISVSLNGIGCAGFSSAHTPYLKTELLAIKCVQHLQPRVFQAMSRKQIDNIAVAAWEQYIIRQQVSHIPPATFSHFQHFISLGKSVPASDAFHPLRGVSERQIAAFTPSTRLAWETCALRDERGNASASYGQQWLLFIVAAIALLL